MVGSFDYNNDDVMNILNNPNYTDDEKKQFFEKYKANLKDKRRKEIISRLNECAKNNPIITEEEYVGFLKQYNNDDLSKPFEVIEKELEIFSNKMQDKYELFLKEKEEQEKQSKREIIPEEPIEEDDITSEITPDVTPKTYGTNDLTNTIFNTPLSSDDDLEPTVFEEKPVKEIMPDQLDDTEKEKGNASAIIISIIAIIIGMVIMYSIIKLK